MMSLSVLIGTMISISGKHPVVVRMAYTLCFDSDVRCAFTNGRRRTGVHHLENKAVDQRKIICGEVTWTVCFVDVVLGRNAM